MPLDRTNGEFIEHLGSEYHVMPVEIYANMPEFQQACEYAAKKFKDAQCIDNKIRFTADDVIAQYYPKKKPTPLLVFIFCKKCRGGDCDKTAMPIERFVTYEFSVLAPNVNAVGHA